MSGVNDSGKNSVIVNEIVSAFIKMSPEDKTVALEKLIEASGSEQRWYLQNRLPDFLFRDFFTLLPDEVLEMILSYLDCMTLLKARQVSKLWNERLSSMPLSYVWQNVASDIGALRHEEEDAELLGSDGLFQDSHEWLRGCAFTHRVRGKIRKGSCFRPLKLSGLTKGFGDVQVTTVDYDVNGELMVAAVSSGMSSLCLYLFSMLSLDHDS